jgi:DNA-binding NarL/FixJ family response regulator
VVVESKRRPEGAAALAASLREHGFEVLGAYGSHEEAIAALTAAAQSASSPAAHPRNRRLSAREREVLALLARGHAYADAARALGVQLSTIQSHVRNIYRKLSVSSKAEAALAGVRLGLISA